MSLDAPLLNEMASLLERLFVDSLMLFPLASLALIPISCRLALYLTDLLTFFLELFFVGILVLFLLDLLALISISCYASALLLGFDGVLSVTSLQGFPRGIPLGFAGARPYFVPLGALQLGLDDSSWSSSSWIS